MSTLTVEEKHFISCHLASFVNESKKTTDKINIKSTKKEHSLFSQLGQKHECSLLLNHELIALFYNKLNTIG